MPNEARSLGQAAMEGRPNGWLHVMIDGAPRLESWSHSDFARLETKMDAAISQAAVDRALTTAHIAECNVRNKIADDRERQAQERERSAAQEWRLFMSDAREDRQKLSEKVTQTQIRLATMIGGVSVVGFVIEHFHLIERALPR